MNIEVILFDLGGVLIELTGIAPMTAWSRLEEDEIWHRWLVSDAVRNFESGRSSPDDFAAGVVAEFELSATPEEFLQAFISWPKGPYDGAMQLLEALQDRFHLSCLSNTNHLHWRRFEEETALLSALHSHFASHHIGKMKPDIEIYEHVIESLDISPGAILFLDDNQVNVDAALQAGMNAVLARGIDDVARRLEDLGLHGNAPTRL